VERRVEGAFESVVGRDRELAVVQLFLDGLTTGARALTIEGGAGIGKTTLWDASVGAAKLRGFHVLSTRSTQSETAMSFSGLIDILDPVPDDLWADLPVPQRMALEVALLRREADRAVESGAISIAFVNVIRAMARTQPVVVAVDDVQWLDQSTARVLEFAIRRLQRDRVGLVVTYRSPSRAMDPFERAMGVDRIQRLTVGPMPMGALYQLIHARLGIALARPMLSRIHETSGGNPLFAIELARFAMEHEDEVLPGRPLPVPDRLTDLLRERLRRLPVRTRRVLLAAAAMSAPRLVELTQFAGPHDDSGLPAEVERAEQAGVLEVHGQVVRFFHPLFASVVYEEAGRSEQRSVHRRLAAVATDPEERARHLALATPGPDETVAAILDRGALRAQARGATDMAAQLAERALALTSPDDNEAIHRRALTAGIHAVSAGDRARARDLFEQASSRARPGESRAESLVRLAELATPLKVGLAICADARAEAGDDPSLLSRIHRTWGAIAYFVGDVKDAEEHATTAVALAHKAGDPTVLAMAMGELGHWTFCAGGGVRRDLFDRAVALDSSPNASAPRSHLATVLMDSGDFAASRPMLEVLVAEAMRLGDLHAAAVHRFHLAELTAWAGDWALAIEHANESLSLRQNLDQPSAPLYVKAMCHACQGRVDEAIREAQAGLADAERADDVVFIMQNLHVLGFVALSMGDHLLAHAHLGRATDLLRVRWNREFGDCHFVPDEIESVIALGELDRAEELVQWMEEVGARTQRPWTLATGARCRAQILAARGDLDRALRAIEVALDAHERLPMPFQLARTRLLKGTIERRLRKRADASTTLASALSTFDLLGAPLWAIKAQHEIDRIGVRSGAQQSLTPVELQIARLIAEGNSNREIAGRLFVSPKTVEASLTRVYRKLEIRSRAELAAWSRTSPAPAET
jgi:DNA-binding CsgD family transcriptional regulator/tetratricopeptide (TPR) repeat protein